MTTYIHIYVFTDDSLSICQLSSILLDTTLSANVFSDTVAFFLPARYINPVIIRKTAHIPYCTALLCFLYNCLYSMYTLLKHYPWEIPFAYFSILQNCTIEYKPNLPIIVYTFFVLW